MKENTIWLTLTLFCCPDHVPKIIVFILAILLRKIDPKINGTIADPSVQIIEKRLIPWKT
jgi:hypothetical protein